MSEDNKENKNLKVIEFKKPQEEENVPEFVVEQLEMMLQKAKEGKLRTIITHFNYLDGEEEVLQGGTLFWNHSQNPLELLGLLEVVKEIAMDHVHDMMHGEGE